MKSSFGQAYMYMYIVSLCKFFMMLATGVKPRAEAHHAYVPKHWTYHEGGFHPNLVREPEKPLKLIKDTNTEIKQDTKCGMGTMML